MHTHHIIEGHTHHIVDVGKLGGSWAGGHVPTLLSSVSLGAVATADNLAQQSQSLMNSMFSIGAVVAGGASLFTPHNLVGSITISAACSAAEVLKASDSSSSGAVTNISEQRDGWISTHRHDHGFGPGHDGSGS